IAPPIRSRFAVRPAEGRECSSAAQREQLVERALGRLRARDEREAQGAADAARREERGREGDAAQERGALRLLALAPGAELAEAAVGGLEPFAEGALEAAPPHLTKAPGLHAVECKASLTSSVRSKRRGGVAAAPSSLACAVGTTSPSPSGASRACRRARSA